MKFQDLIAGAMTIILLLSIIAFTLIEVEIPEVLVGAFGISVGWVFSRSINGKVNDIQRKVINGNRKD